MTYIHDRKRRTIVKLRMIEAMGGKCQICGYSKCHSAMHFHHLDPKEKDFAFCRTSLSYSAWPKLVKELEKCILLCGNCHQEIHLKITQIPENFQGFDDNYRIWDYK